MKGIERADAAQRFSDLYESSTTIQTTITTKASEAVGHLDAHSTSTKHNLNGMYETMKSDFEEKIKLIDTRSSTSLHAINHSSDKCKGNHDHVENKIKSYIASKIKELNKSIATKLTTSFKIQQTKLTKQIGETHLGISESAIKNLIETTCSTSSFLVNMINDKVMARIDDSMLEIDDKISKSVAAKVRKEKQRTAKLDDKVQYESAPDYVESEEEI